MMRKVTIDNFRRYKHTFFWFRDSFYIRRLSPNGVLEAISIVYDPDYAGWSEDWDNLEEFFRYTDVVYQLTQKEVIQKLRAGGWKNALRMLKYE